MKKVRITNEAYNIVKKQILSELTVPKIDMKKNHRQILKIITKLSDSGKLGTRPRDWKKNYTDLLYSIKDHKDILWIALEAYNHVLYRDWKKFATDPHADYAPQAKKNPEAKIIMSIYNKLAKEIER